MIRIGGGDFRGRTLRTSGTMRPTSSALKKSLFDRYPVEGRTVMDVCAGSGAVGIEALGRGAKFCTFIETHPSALIDNLNALKIGPDEAALERVVAHRARGRASDWIFLDPPYELLSVAWLKKLPWAQWLSGENGLVLIEGPAGLELPLATVHEYGDSWVSVYLGLPTLAE